jgi:hypothetical protein
MRIEDIRIGAKVVYFDGDGGRAVEATVTAVLDAAPPARGRPMVYARPDGGGEDRAERKLFLDNYKKDDCRYLYGELAWCFAANGRFRAHMEARRAPRKAPAKKEPDPRYASLDHGNNERMRAAAISAQRGFVNKAMEQGFYWQREFVRGGGHAWVRREKPEFEFNYGEGGYSLSTPDGWVRGRKFGRAVVADEPEGNGAESPKGENK